MSLCIDLQTASTFFKYGETHASKRAGSSIIPRKYPLAAEQIVMTGRTSRNMPSRFYPYVSRHITVLPI